MTPNERLKHQYQGFKDQPNLWEAINFYKYPQINIPFVKELDFTDIDIHKHHRLGKLVEVFYQKNLETLPNYTPIANNIQIQVDKHQTLGELDFVCNTPTGIHHIELTYKFYLYKTDVATEMERWIGPNLKDSLVKKLQKLEVKQFPMLHHPICKKLFLDKGFVVDEIQQSVQFKAQLYIPLHLKNHVFPHVNNKCINGYYINYQQLNKLSSSYLYHVPVKQDWLIHPKHHKTWQSLSEVKPIILEQIEVKHSPLIWIKNEDTYQRLFITFW